MKQNKLVRKAGPYKVVSISQDWKGVRLEVYPAWPEYDEECDEYGGWANKRVIVRKGGGPSIFASIALASAMEKFLNQQYTEARVTTWKNKIEEVLRSVKDKIGEVV